MGRGALACVERKGMGANILEELLIRIRKLLPSVVSNRKP